jgi:hypothetical protein
MKSLISSLATVLILVACGGNGTTAPPENVQDRSGGDRQVNARFPDRTDHFVFYTEIVPGSLAPQKPLYFSAGADQPLQEAYLVSNLDGLKNLKRIFSGNQEITFGDLSIYTYFLVRASDCPAYSELAEAEYGEDQITIGIHRYQPRQDAACPATLLSAFHVFSAQKSHAPEILFESLTPQSSSQISNERFPVIRDEAAFTALWEEHHRGQTPVPALPAIDFSQKMVVGVYLGTRPNGCYSVHIDRIYQSGDRNIVEYTERVPAPDSICTTALVFPAHLVAIPRTPYPFELRKTVRPIDNASKTIS